MRSRRLASVAGRIGVGCKLGADDRSVFVDNYKVSPPMNRRRTVLVVDDDSITAEVLSAHLATLDVNVILAANGLDGIEQTKRILPDLILLDVQMPGDDGFEVCRQLKADEITRQIPIIFLTGETSTESKVQAFEQGAFDYVTKPFNAAELKARVAAALRMVSLVEQLDHQARTDHLTGIANRDAFAEALGRAFRRAQHEENYGYMLLFLDCDRFKVINDSLGHLVGDELLVQMANRICTMLDAASIGPEWAKHVVARLGGDEFVILLDGVTDMNTTTSFAGRLQGRLGEHYLIANHRLKATVSIGIVRSDNGYQSPQDTLRDADTAMYHAKQSGKARHVVFDKEMHEQALMRLTLENDLHDVLANGELQLYYQPIMSLQSGRIAGFEALVRWIHPERGMISPAQFIPVAEETGLILPIGRWVMEEACTQLRTWRHRIPGQTDLTMNINISRKQMYQPDFSDVVHDVVLQTNVDPAYVKLEVTESVIMQNAEQVMYRMRELKEIGVQLAMDDFGTGHSSLSCLSKFPMDSLKIDREFILNMTRDRTYSAVLNSIVTLAQNLNLKVVAEGLETGDQVSALIAMDCDYAQGFYFSRPVPAAEAENLLIHGIHHALSA